MVLVENEDRLISVLSKFKKLILLFLFSVWIVPSNKTKKHSPTLVRRRIFQRRIDSCYLELFKMSRVLPNHSLTKPLFE